MFDFLKKQVSGIFYFYIEEEEIGKHRKRLKSRFERGSTVVGTMSFHYFEPISKFATGAKKEAMIRMDELETALMSLKPGKAAGFDEIYPEFIKNFGAQTKEWIISFMNDIVSTSKIPNLFKRAKVISIIKPGKD
jgi:hypothetical protein